MIGLLLCALSACQGPKIHPNDPTAMSHASFMDLWQTYTHCRTSDDPGAIFMDALRLNQAAGGDHPELPRLLQTVKPLVSDLPSRLAVDPGSMAVSCSLHAGQAAAAIGWNDLAIKLYQSVLRHSSSFNESYYLRQAQEGLAEIESRGSSQLRVPPMSLERPPAYAP